MTLALTWLKVRTTQISGQLVEI